MASELSQFIEDELRNKGYAYEDEEENPHQTLIGALRVEARVKEQETQKKLFNIKRVVCIGGGVALVLVAWALLIASSKTRVDPEYQSALTDFEGITADGATITKAASSKQAPASSSSQRPATKQAGGAGSIKAPDPNQPSKGAGASNSSMQAPEQQQQQQNATTKQQPSPAPSAAVAGSSTTAAKAANSTAAADVATNITAGSPPPLPLAEGLGAEGAAGSAVDANVTSVKLNSSSSNSSAASESTSEEVAPIEGGPSLPAEKSAALNAEAALEDAENAEEDAAEIEAIEEALEDQQGQGRRLQQAVSSSSRSRQLRLRRSLGQLQQQPEHLLDVPL